MKKLYLFFSLLLLSILPTFAQQRKAPVKPAARKVLTKPKTATSPTPVIVTEIPEKDWNALTDVLNKEDWTQAANLSVQWLGKIKTENDKKQLAQLRYFYLYALAGKVNDGKAFYPELEKAARGLIGAQFMMPNRTILVDCTEKINYICASKNNDQVLRVTATDKVANIHSLEYVKLAEKFDTPGNSGKSAALIGNLETVETYTGKTNIKVLRLIFGGGSVMVIP